MSAPQSVPVLGCRLARCSVSATAFVAEVWVHVEAELRRRQLISLGEATECVQVVPLPRVLQQALVSHIVVGRDGQHGLGQTI